MALTEENFEGFDREYFPNVYYAGMLQYDSEAGIPPKFLVEPPKISNTLTEELIKYNINELAVSETQKFGHVTYFWNGNRQDKFDENLETYIEIPSDNISFDKAPAMKAREITDKVIEEMKTNKYQFVRLNFPNGDMVGHTGNYEATVESLEVVDECLGRLEAASKELDYVMLLMADHGNSEVMYTEKDGVRTPKTSHTCNPVPFVVLDNSYKLKEGNFGLSNVAASVLKIYCIEKPVMWNDSIIE
jgi:2,3-bisphosphoglycerate-independent phosphoglycerate mutase